VRGAMAHSKRRATVGRAGLKPPTAAATMELLLKPFLIFIGMKEMEEGL
jgi:hypothetical protein